MRFSGAPAGLALALACLGAAPASFAQISYLSRESFIGYLEQDFDLLTSQFTFEQSGNDGTTGLGTFNSFVGMPGQANPFDDTGAGQFSQLFADAIEFDTRVHAEEDRTDNAFGIYDAAAISQFVVEFQVDEDAPFQVLGTRFDASLGSRPGSTTFSLTGPGVDISQSSGVLDEIGAFQANQTYRLEAEVESIGQYEDGFLGVNRTRGEDLGFDFLLILVTGDPIVGDYDDSGQVEQGDLDIVLQNWGTGTFTGDEGSLVGGGPFDGTVDQNELDGVLQNWGSTAAPDFTGAAVPEPAWGAGVLALLCAHRRSSARR